VTVKERATTLLECKARSLKPWTEPQ